MRSFILLVAPLLLAPLSACGDEGPTAPVEESIAGTYVLRTVGGSPLPATVFEVGGDRLEVTDGQIVLHADETFSSSLELRETSQGEATTSTRSAEGTYNRVGNVIEFTSSSGATNTATLEGDRLRTTVQGLVLVFER